MTHLVEHGPSRPRRPGRVCAAVAGALAVIVFSAAGAAAAPVTFHVWPAGQGRIVASQPGTADQACDFLAVLSTELACDVTVDDARPVTLTATALPDATFPPGFPGSIPPDFPAPPAEVRFVRWSRFDCAGIGPCTFVPSTDEWVSAIFTPLQLEVYVQGASAGLLAARRPDGTPAPLACEPSAAGGDTALCHGLFAADSDVVLAGSLVAAPSPTNQLVWDPGCESTGPTCTVTMSNIRTFATVAFGDPALVAPDMFPFRVRSGLKVRRTGTGRGTVTGSGISCGATCSVADLLYQDRVTLRADAADGSRFVRWSGICGSGATCAFRAGSATVVGAVFEALGGPGGTPRQPAPQPPRRGRPFQARLGRVRVTGHGRRRVLRMTVIADRRADARLRLLRGRRTVASRRSTVRAGRTTLRLRVPRRSRRGNYRVVLRLAAGADRRTLRAALRMPR